MKVLTPIVLAILSQAACSGDNEYSTDRTSTTATTDQKLHLVNCVDPDLTLVSVNTELMLCDGTIANGQMESLQSCSQDGETGCVARGKFRAANTTEIADKIALGQTVAGISGTLEPMPPDCSEDGETGCVTSEAFKAARMSNFTSAAISTGTTIAGVDGANGANPACSSDGDINCLVDGATYKAAAVAGLANKVLSGQTVAGVPGNVVLPAVGNVRLGTDYGVGGNGNTGTFSPDYPDAANVRANDTTNGVSGTLDDCDTDGDVGCVATGSYIVADTTGLAAKVISGQTVAGVSGSAEAKLPDCASDGDTSCSIDDGTNFKAADTSNLVAGNIKRGMQIGGVVGNYPSAASPLARYADSGATTNTTGSDETDLTLFSTQLTTDGTFEYWTSAGVRLTGSGDSDLAEVNIKSGVNIESLGLTGSYGGGGPEPDAWDLRAGVTVGSVTGKLKVDCRNSIDSATYNYDGDTNSLTYNPDTSGSAYDWWDTIDDEDIGQPSSTGFPAAWPVSENYCGGVEASAGDDNVWRDLTADGACDTEADECIYLDKISGLVWAEKLSTTMRWNAAADACNDLTFAGETDWRLPTQKEMMAAYTHGIKVLESALFIADMDVEFWTATTKSVNPDRGWVVELGSGFTYDLRAKSALYSTTCVREL